MSFTFVNSTTNGNASATTIALSVPSGTVDNDLMLATVSVAADGVGIGCAGWTLLYEDTTWQYNGIFYKYAYGESGNYTFGTLGTADMIGGTICTYRGLIVPQTASVEYHNATASVILPSLTPLTGNAVLFAVASIASTSTITVPGSMTTRATVSTGLSVKVCDEQLVGTAASGTRTFTWTGSVYNGGVMISLRQSAMYGNQLMLGL